MHVLAWFNASIFTSRHLVQVNMQDININKDKKLKDLGVNKLQVCKMVVWQFKVNLGYANISVLNPNELYPLAVKHKIDKINNEDQKNWVILFADVLMKKPSLICHLPLLLWSCLSLSFTYYIWAINYVAVNEWCLTRLFIVNTWWYNLRSEPGYF